MHVPIVCVVLGAASLACFTSADDVTGVAAAGGGGESVGAVSCRNVKTEYKKQACCGSPDKAFKKWGLEAIEQASPCLCLGEFVKQSVGGFAWSIFAALQGESFDEIHGSFMAARGFPLSFGLDCAAHDLETDDCKPGGKMHGRDWCPMQWCYVTGYNCPGAERTINFPGSVISEWLAYSYHQCNETVPVDPFF
mmetsp:Transcript_21193/g.59278  ORF Transcript_21193/g.59278 Transcript_21193/m.59278 type:complete len:194 (-) Transcript_21193:356-937(-)